ncbi:2-oxoacid:ferredoxin oxidoreductase subunit gamma [Candidatus Bathyarchaeota archaeon]|nr:2-oxoacid:ferredoxin oxidoreductase subunit gamma [Candidatus Bathyarchaeota archaeon]
MGRIDIRIAGFGGQGVILAGLLLGKAAVIYDKKKAVQTQSYGAEARGGAARSEVVIADEPIDYPKVISADILVAMSQEAVNRYFENLKGGATVIVDADLVSKVPICQEVKVYKVPATSVATKEFGNQIVANMIMLGALVGLTNAVSETAIRTAVMEGVPEGTREVNLQALEKGLSFARLLKKARNYAPL